MTRYTSQFFFVLASSSAALACGGTDDSKGGTPGPGTSQYTAAAMQPCDPALHTPYADDNLCLAPPPPDVGFQLYVGPGTNSNYDDPNAVAKYVLGPGDEGVLCVAATTGNAEDVYTQEHHVRTRTGTHHIIYWREIDPTQSLIPPDGTFDTQCRGSNQAFFIGMESGLTPAGGTLDVPLPGDVSKYTAEERGAAMKVRAKTRVWVETHFVNTSADTPLLREAWANFAYMDASKVTTIIDPIFFIGGLTMAVPPGATQVITAGPVTKKAGVTGELRLMGLAGHAHAHTVRESIFLTHNGTENVVYQTFNWSEPLWAQFDEAHTNPTIAPGKDGAISGPFVFQEGDSLRWECEVNNTTNPPVTLVFADRAYDAEMCNVFGYYTPGDGTDWGTFF